jgi:hypothetical protein
MCEKGNHELPSDPEWIIFRSVLFNAVCMPCFALLFTEQFPEEDIHP